MDAVRIIILSTLLTGCSNQVFRAPALPPDAHLQCSKNSILYCEVHIGQQECECMSRQALQNMMDSIYR